MLLYSQRKTWLTAGILSDFFPSKAMYGVFIDDANDQKESIMKKNIISLVIVLSHWNRHQ